MSETTKMRQAPEQIVDLLAATGVMRVCGSVGDYLNGLTKVCAASGGPGKPVMSRRDDWLIDHARTNLRH